MLAVECNFGMTFFYKCNCSSLNKIYHLKLILMGLLIHRHKDSSSENEDGLLN